jgi:hypothetical protein
MMNRTKYARNHENKGKPPVGSKKIDNSPQAQEAKLDLRRRVLQEIHQARVFDAFCGRGEMYRGVWKDAALYVGCDERPWHREDPPRFVADNLRLMRAIDLGRFNVFDLDAYGSPWEQAVILAARRRWAPGERGALVLTDGSAFALGYTHIPPGMRELAGLKGRDGPSTKSHVGDLMDMARRGWARRASVTIVKIWQAQGQSKAEVVYSALVFEGARPV